MTETFRKLGDVASEVVRKARPRIPPVTASGIVAALAAIEPTAPSEVDGDPSCFFCSAHLPEKLVDHDETCLWRMANESPAS